MIMNLMNKQVNVSTTGEQQIEMFTSIIPIVNVIANTLADLKVNVMPLYLIF